MDNIKSYNLIVYTFMMDILREITDMEMLFIGCYDHLKNTFGPK